MTFKSETQKNMEKYQQILEENKKQFFIPDLIWNLVIS